MNENRRIEGGRWTGCAAVAAAALLWWGTALGAPTPSTASDRRANPTPVADFDTLAAAATFDSVWTRIRNTHYDPELRGVDWEGARAELRPRAVAAASAEELRTVLRDLLDRLGESHFVLIAGEAAPAFSGDPPPSGPPGDTGLDVRWVDGALTIVSVRGPAAAAGIRPGWTLEAVGDASIDSLQVMIRDQAPPDDPDRHLATWLPIGARNLLAGPRGSEVHLTLRDQEATEQTFDVRRVEPPGEAVRFGNLPPFQLETAHSVRSVDGDVRVGFLHFSAWFPAAVPDIARAIDEMRDVDGIVLDLRGNPGGVGGLVIGIGGHFLDERVDLGEMRTRETTLRFVVNPQRIAPDGRRVDPYAGPLAILVDPLTASTSEIFAAGLQARGRARIFGEPTAGQALPSLVIDLPNGDRLMHAIADFTAPDGSRLEGRGVAPDLLVPPTRDGLLEDRDRAGEEAVRWIREQAVRGRSGL